MALHHFVARIDITSPASIQGWQLVFHACTDGHATRQAEVGGMLVVDASFPAGAWLPAHDHPRPSLVVVLSGTFHERTGGVEIEAGKGTLYLRAAGSHAAHQIGAEPTRCLIAELMQRPDIALGSDGNDAPLVMRAGNCGRLGARIARLSWDQSPANRLRLESMLLELLACVASRIGGPREEPPEWLRKVHDELWIHFREPPSVTELAAAAGVHQSQLLRRFRRHYGMSPTGLVRRWKAEHAKMLLARPGASLSAVAFEAGFADQSHMGRVLRRVYGTTPRRLQRAELIAASGADARTRTSPHVPPPHD